jgi:hypothetical protein
MPALALRRITLVLMAWVAVFGAVAWAADRGVLLRSGDRLEAELTPGDEDAFDVEAAAGGAVRFRAEARGESEARPQVRLFQPDGTEFDLAKRVRGGGKRAVRVGAVRIPDGQTGRWQFRVSGADDTTGAYRVSARIDAPPPTAVARLTVPVGERVVVPFAGETGATARVRVAAKCGAPPSRVTVLDPSGTEIPEIGSVLETTRDGGVAGRVPLPQGFGTYTVAIDGAPEASPDGESRVSVQVAVRPAKRKARRETLPPEATFGPLLPAIAEQREQGLVVDLQATNVLPETGATVDGEGVAVRSLEVSDTGAGFLVLDVADDAPLGARRLVFFPPELLGESVALDAALTVMPPGPQLGAMTPDVLAPGTSRAALRIAGDFFNEGTVVEFNGGDVVVHEAVYVDAATLDLVVSVAADAPVGARTCTITPGPGGGPPHAFRRALTIAAAEPVITAFSHVTLAQGAAAVPVSVHGRNFRDGDTVTGSGAGVTFTSVTFVNETQLTAIADVASDAAAGSRSLTVAHSSADGARATTRSAAFRVISGTPTVAAVSPSAIGVTGTGGPTREVPLEIDGTNFMTGAAVAVTRSGGSGLTVVPATARVVSDTRMTVTVSVTGTASTGLWDVRVANPGALGDSGTTGNGALDVRPASSLTVNRILPSSGGPWGGERVTVQGSGFVDGCTVDFGTARAYGTQVIDACTLVTIVPPPPAPSTSASTFVDVKVTVPGGSSATLRRGWEYARDAAAFRVVATVPAQSATSVVRNLKSAVLVLSAPLDPATGLYGSNTGTSCFWFESGGSFTPGGFRAVGPGGRFLVLSRSSGGSLPIGSAGTYVLDVPTALRSRSGAALMPARLAVTENHDQYTFTVSQATLDGTAPSLSTISPANGSTGQDTATSVILTFSEALDPATVSPTSIALRQGATAVPAAIGLSDDLRTVTIVPENELAAGTTYTVALAATVTDLCGNTLPAGTQTFTTASADTTAPSVSAVIVESLPSSVDGSGTYVGANGVAGRAFDLLVPRDGWTIDVRFTDAGGSGVDASTFSAKCSTAVGAFAANAELASSFTVTSTGAVWTVPATARIATGDDVTFTFTVRDRAGNVSAARTITVDVTDPDTSSANGDDLDPIDARRTWILRSDIDAFTTSFAATTTPSAQQGATTTVAANGIPDLDEALRLIGLGSASPTTEAANATNGLATGTNAIVRRLFLERFRELLNERFDIDADGSRRAESVDVEFLLPGEQGSLASPPSYSTANSSSSSKPFSEISVGGTYGADSSAYTAAGTIGDAWFDARNRREEANLNLGGSTDTGVFLLGAFKLQVNSNALFLSKVSRVLVTVHGGTPVGQDGLDDDVLAGSFDRTASTDAAKNARYDAIHDAIEHAALYASAITAHEIGHSLGLVPDGGPATGTFGAAHHSNTFTEATSANPNTTHHLDFLGNDLMAAATTFDSAAWTGTDFKRFSPLDLAYLRNHVLADEAR